MGHKPSDDDSFDDCPFRFFFLVVGFDQLSFVHDYALVISFGHRYPSPSFQRSWCPELVLVCFLDGSFFLKTETFHKKDH